MEEKIKGITQCILASLGSALLVAGAIDPIIKAIKKLKRSIVGRKQRNNNS